MSEALTPIRVRQLIVNRIPKRKFQGVGPVLPTYAVNLMHRTYLEVGSLLKAAKLFHRHWTDLRVLFHRRGLWVRPARKVASFAFNGQRFGKMGRNWVALSKPRQTLQKAVYEHNFGKVPKGTCVHFRSLDRSDFRPANLVALTKQEGMAAAKAQRKAPN